MTELAVGSAQLAADHMGGDLLAALVDELRLLPKPWPSLPAVEQTELIERLRKRVTANVRQAVEMIIAGGRITVSAKLESMTLKEGCKIGLTVDGSKAKHDLLDAIGGSVVVVLANLDLYLGGIGDVKADDDQRALDLQQAADDAIGKAKAKPKTTPPATDPDDEP